MKQNRFIKNNHGITLIALVVTIVVLLILAGITIQLVFSDGGIFNQAQNAKVQTRIGELLDKFNMSEAVLAAEKLGKTTLEEYIKQIQEKEGYIIEAEEQDDGSYNVTTEDGYVFNVSIIEGTDTNDIVIEYIGQAGNLPPVVKVKEVTTNSATIELSRIDGITSYKYEYKKHDESEYKESAGTENTCTFTGLTNNTIYDIKVTVIKDGQEIVIEKQIAVGKIPTGGVIKLKSVTWSNNKATAIVYHEESASYRIEWQLMGSTIWNQGEIGVKEISIPNLNHNDTILLRLNDETSSGSDASVSIIDTIAPQPATISFSQEAAQTGTNITATVTLKDNESGINNGNSRYVFSKSSSPLGTENTSLYTGGTFASTTAITIKGTIGTWYLHVLSVDNAGNKAETISKEIKIIEPIDRSRVGNIDIVFLNGKTPISSSSVPTPKLGTGMTPIKWNGSTVVTTTTSDPEWYDYSQKKWANAQTADGSMWVWIPRYAYMIEYLGSDGETVVGYSNSDGITDINGNIATGTAKTGVVAINGTVEGKTISKYVLHPAFTVNSNNGGWSSDIPGIWVAKFEASSVEGNSNSSSGDNVATKTIQVKPGVASWRSIQVSNIYTNCLKYNNSLNSHMMKNSEWGAVAYLSKSVYGINGEITINDSSSFYTGGGIGTSYITNTVQSTTGNVYGIYDISGGALEYVASYVNNGNSYLTYGASLVNSTSSYLKQVYSQGSTDNKELNYQANSSRYGDAVYETSNTVNSSSGSWYGDYSNFPYSNFPFFVRGGSYYHGSYAGAFASDVTYGQDSSYVSFRPVLVVP